MGSASISGSASVRVVLHRHRGGAVVEDDELAAVGGLEGSGREDLARGPERDLPAVEAEHAVPRPGLVGVVGRHEQRAPLRPQRVEEGLDPRGARRVDARQGLVEQQDAGVLHERAGDQHALALAARQRAEALALPLREPDPSERGARRGAIGPREAPEPARAPVGPHQRDVEGRDGEVEARALRLRHIRRAAGELDGAPALGQLAQQRAEQRALAAAVGAEHRDDLTGADGEADLRQRVGAGAIAAGEPLDAHERAAHARPRVTRATTAKTAPPSTAIAGPGARFNALAAHSATTPSAAASAPVPSWSERRSGASSRTVAAGTTRTTETSSAPTAASATITAAATATSSARSGPATATPSALAPSGSKARASQARRNAPCATSTTAAVAAVRSTSRSLSPISVPNNRRSTPAPER